jgi:hypothetical protein
LVGFDVLQQQINLIRRFFSNALTPDSLITPPPTQDIGPSCPDRLIQLSLWMGYGRISPPQKLCQD